jgi:hypothetical protein
MSDDYNWINELDKHFEKKAQNTVIPSEIIPSKTISTTNMNESIIFLRSKINTDMKILIRETNEKIKLSENFDKYNSYILEFVNKENEIVYKIQLKDIVIVLEDIKEHSFQYSFIEKAIKLLIKHNNDP